MGRKHNWYMQARRYIVNRAEYLVYIKQYQQRRRTKRREYAINKLGGKCTNCGTIENLEFDHVIPINEPKGKRRISELLTARIYRLNAELELCQLLCEECHKIKTAFEDRQHASKTHGTLSSVRYCKPICDACRIVRDKYQQEYRLRRK